MKVLTKEMIKDLDRENNEYYFTTVANFNGLNLGDMFLGILIYYEQLIEVKKNKKIILLTHKTLLDKTIQIPNWSYKLLLIN